MESDNVFEHIPPSKQHTSLNFVNRRNYKIGILFFMSILIKRFIRLAPRYSAYPSLPLGRSRQFHVSGSRTAMSESDHSRRKICVSILSTLLHAL